jgi:hypothetical protein
MCQYSHKALIFFSTTAATLTYDWTTLSAAVAARAGAAAATASSGGALTGGWIM